jgi:hypothetical protein
MSYNAVRQSNEETSLKDILAVILENFGVSKQETDNLVSLLDTQSKSIINENENYLFKFENNEIKFDFGSDINDAIKSSYIMIYLNDSFDMKKIELHFFTDNSKEIVIANYNSEYEFIDLKYDNPEMRKIKERIKIEQEQQELQKLERQKQMEEAILFTRIEKNKKIIGAIKSKLKILNDTSNDFEYVCNNFLLNGVEYKEWKINNHKKFTIWESDKDKKLSISTNIFNTGIFPVNSSFVVQKCDILFDADMKISNFNFIIKQVKLGDYWMYSFDLDSNFNLIKFYRIDMIHKKMKSTDEICDSLTFEELVFILKFKLSDNDAIYEIIPEVVVPSAYDFNSEDFNKRLLIAEMLLV